MKTQGPQLKFSEELHARKYRGPGESFREGGNRIAGALTDNPQHFKAFRDIYLDQRFLPAGRVQSAAGAAKTVTAYNCFVSGTIEDSFVEGKGAIMKRAEETAQTLRMGGGLGLDFSPLRPRGDLIRKLASRSTGPVSFMDIYNSIGLCTSSTDHRRGALMGTLRIDHPDILEFIRAKQNSGKLNGFNISVWVTDEFMHCLATDEPFALRFEGRVHSHISAKDLWDTLMRSAYDWAEPGVIFGDTVNRLNNLRYCETIASTNPCGEQPLPPYGACLLGSYNLTKYLYKDLAGWRLDLQQLIEDVPPVVRAMDNVVDRSSYPLFEQEKEAKSKRRMGLGVTGLANALEACGTPYGSEGFVRAERAIFELLAVACYRASCDLAEEKGAFPLLDAERYLEAGTFASEKLPTDVHERIRRTGIRNSHLTSQAPTGTISLTADNVSSSIEPVFAYGTERTLMEFDGPKQELIEDYGVRVLGVRGKKSSEVTVKEHLDVLVAAQEWTDSAVSKTCNVPANIAWDDFKSVYSEAWRRGAKGCTTYRVGGMRTEAVLKEAEEEGAACTIDPLTGTRTCE